jgi:hypothetical protein
MFNESTKRILRDFGPNIRIWLVFQEQNLMNIFRVVPRDAQSS